ncbi:MAG: hypothetical protein AB1439_05030 [candidate division FCPU426 bacterium]
MAWKIAGALGLCLLTILSGIWLSHSGRPLSTLIITLHKLLALGMAVLAVMAAAQWLRVGEKNLLTLLLLILAGLLVAIQFATGAFLSSGKPAFAAFRTIHQIATLLTVGTAVALLWGPK